MDRSDGEPVVTGDQLRTLSTQAHDLAALIDALRGEAGAGSSVGAGHGLRAQVGELGMFPPVEAPVELSLRELVELLSAEAIGAVLVRGADGLVGIVSERDVLRAIADGADLDIATLADVMAEWVATVDAGDTIESAAITMASRDVRHVPVVSGGRVVGMMSARDVLDVIAGALADGEP
jgi:CBS domain-containing protein